MKNKIRPSRWLYVLSAVIFVVGITLFIYILITGLLSMGTNISSEKNRIAVPGKSTVEFDTAGKKHVFYEFNSVYNGRMYSTPQEISGLYYSLKEKNTGKEIKLKKTFGNYYYCFNSHEGRSIFEFYIDEPGSYVFEAWYEDNDSPTVIMVLGEGFGFNLFMTIIGGFLVLFLTIAIAVLILVFTIIKRNKSRKALRAKEQNPQLDV